MIVMSEDGEPLEQGQSALAVGQSALAVGECSWLLRNTFRILHCEKYSQHRFRRRNGRRCARSCPAPIPWPVDTLSRDAERIRGPRAETNCVLALKRTRVPLLWADPVRTYEFPFFRACTVSHAYSSAVEDKNRGLSQARST